MTKEEAIQVLRDWDGYFIGHGSDDVNAALNMAIETLETTLCIKEKCAYCPHCKNCDVDDEILAIKALEQEPRKGHWLRMSDLSEQEDDRYKCSHCGNVVRHTNKMNLYTFNSWCGRCGSDNGRKRGQE